MDGEKEGLHFSLHLVEGGLGLFEEAKYYRLGKVSVILFVHVKYLSEGGLVDMVAEVKVDLCRLQSVVALWKKGSWLVMASVWAELARIGIGQDNSCGLFIATR